MNATFEEGKPFSGYRSTRDATIPRGQIRRMLETVRSYPLHYADAAAPAPERRSAPMSVRGLFDILLRRRWIILVCMASSLGAGIAYTKLAAPKYAAMVTLLIDARLAQISPTEASAAIVDQAAVDSQIEIMRSEKNILDVINKLQLISDPDFGGRRTAEARSPEELDLANRRAIASLSGNLLVARVGRSYLVSVTYTSGDPVKAARIANEVASAYIADQVGAKVDTSKDQYQWLSGQVNELRTRAVRDYRAVQDFKAGNDINPLRDLGVQHDLDSLVAEIARARAATESTRTAAERVSAVARRAPGASAVPETDAVQGLDDQALTELAGQLADRRTQLAALGREPGADPGRLAQARQEASATETQIRARLDQLSADQTAAWKAAYARQQALETRLASLRLRDTRARLVQERLRELETAAATSRSLYESFLNQLTHAAQQQPVPTSDARIISAASIPLAPSTPKKSLAMVLATMMGLTAAAVAIFLAESVDDVIRTRGGLEQASNLVTLGVIPNVDRRGQRRRLTLRDRPSPGLPPLLTTKGSRSRAADTLRSLRLAADFGAEQSGARVIGITSAVPGEGKSTVAANMAMSAVQAGRRVLLIDCQVRNPTVTTALNGGRRSEDEADVQGPYGLGQVIRTDKDLFILPAPALDTIDDAELPDARLLGAAIAEARTRFDLVILDLPAILPSFTVRGLVHLTDSLVLVTAWGHTTVAQVERALSRFSTPGLFLGAILNRARLRKMRRFEGSVAGSYADAA